MHEVLRGTPIYQEILKEGRLEGIDEGIHVGELKNTRQMIEKFVGQKYPTLQRLAHRQVMYTSNLTLLTDLFFKLINVNNVEEARQLLRSIDDYEE